VSRCGVSIDSHFSHIAWKNTPSDKGGIGQVQYRLIADLTKQIARDYDVLTADGAVAFRGTFLIDKNGIVRHQVVNDLSLGRNIEEIRMVDALQIHEQHGEVCLAGWNKGKEGMKANSAGVASYLAKNAKASVRRVARIVSGDTSHRPRCFVVAQSSETLLQRRTRTMQA